MLHQGETVPVETMEDLLDLLCFYNSGDRPEHQYVEEQHFRLLSGEKMKRRIKSTWK